jgi:hypothetical protein
LEQVPAGPAANEARHSWLLPIHADAEALHGEQDAGDQREEAGDPDRDGKSEEEVKAEDDEEEGKEEIRHGGQRLEVFCSDSIREYQQEPHAEHPAEAAAGMAAPIAMVRPAGRGAEQEHDEHNQ